MTREGGPPFARGKYGRVHKLGGPRGTPATATPSRYLTSFAIAQDAVAVVEDVSTSANLDKEIISPSGNRIIGK